MRRHERQVTDTKDITAVIENCNVCRLAMTDGAAPYIVPLNFGFEFYSGNLTLYFHSAGEGRKIDILRKNPVVGFEMDNNRGLKDGGTAACRYSIYYESVIGTGKAEFVTGYREKKAALEKLMKHMTLKENLGFNDEFINAVTIFTITSTDFTVKKREQNC